MLKGHCKRHDKYPTLLISSQEVCVSHLFGGLNIGCEQTALHGIEKLLKPVANIMPKWLLQKANDRFQTLLISSEEVSASSW